MKTYAQFSIQALNSFNIEAISPKIYFPSSLLELTELANINLASFYIMGEGSNTLFCDKQAPVIIKPDFKGIELKEDEHHFYANVACAENWHELVEFCIKRGIFGLENLALIPGSVGAAPVQNIGAYGVEVADFIDSVSWFDFSKKKLVEYKNSQCQFAYRDSIFKQRLKGKGVITHVYLKFPKAWQPILSYQGLNTLNSPASAEDIMLKVIELRQYKLPDPSVLANAGSFFKNPIVSSGTFKTLLQQYPQMPYYLQSDDDVKLAAGWLIEQAGLKGFRQGDAGVHEKQALVLVNYAHSSGKNITDLSFYIQKQVMAKFDIILVPEVRFVGQNGEIDAITARSSSESN